MRNVRRVLAVGALVSLAFVAAPPVTAQPSTDDAETPTVTSVIGSADGLYVGAQLGPPTFDFVTFGPEPSVTLPPEGGSVSDEVADVSFPAAFDLRAELVAVAAEGEVGPDGFATAEVTVAELSDIGGPIAEAITGTCSADLDGVTGSSTLVGLELGGEDLSGEPEPNTSFGPITVDGWVLSGTLNQQVENPDGSLSVTPLVYEIVEGEGEPNGPEPGELILELEIGPVTCGVVEGEPEPEPAEPVVVTPVFTG
jgi:hypothetical protein